MPAFSASAAGVGQVAVVPEREAGAADGPVDGLRPGPVGGPVRRVAGVADGEVTLEPRERALVEDGGDQAHVLDDGDGVAVAHRHAGRLLAAVLQGEETVEREVGHPHPGRVDPEDSAGFLHAPPILAQARAITVRPGRGPGSPRAPGAGRRAGGRPGRPGCTGRRPPGPARRPGSRRPRPGGTTRRDRRVATTKREGSSVNSSAGSSTSSEQPVPAATAISASATARPPPETSCTACTEDRLAVGAGHLRRRPAAATKAQHRAVGGEVDGGDRPVRWSRRSVAQRVPSSGKDAVRRGARARAARRRHRRTSRARRRRVDRVDEAEHAEHRRGVDVGPAALVVEADVAADDRERQGAAGLGHPVDALGELPHHLGVLGVPEVQAVHDGDRRGTDAGQVGHALGQDERGAGARVERAGARVGVGRERHAAVPTAAGPGPARRSRAASAPGPATVLRNSWWSYWR